MVTLKRLAEEFENGLNKILDNPEIQFKIWCNAGEYQNALREGNTITHYINGNLRTSTSANDATSLVMGVNGLSLDFMIPVKPPRTNAKQTVEELAKIKDGQYPFIEYIVNAVNNYFQTAQSIWLKDESNVLFSVAFKSGTAVTGLVDLLPVIGNCMEISVYIEVYFIEGGTNSKDVKIKIEGVAVPYQALRLGRSPIVEREVFAENLISKSVITSTAVAVDIDYPSTNNGASVVALDYLLDGEPNVAHFVEIEWGIVKNKLYFMTINSAVNSAQGIAIAGMSISLMEVGNNIYNVPDNYGVGRFILPDSNAKQLSVQFSRTFPPTIFKAYIGGICQEIILSRTSVELTPAMIIYDEEKEIYYVEAVFDRAVTVASATADNVAVEYIEVKAAK